MPISPEMESFYLSSRTELFRAIDLDTGRSLLLVDVPNVVKEWMEIGLPDESTIWNTKDAFVEGSFDVVLWWVKEDRMHPEFVQKLEGRVKENGEMWAFAPRSGAIYERMVELTQPEVEECHIPLPFDLERDLIPLKVRRVVFTDIRG